MAENYEIPTAARASFLLNSARVEGVDTHAHHLVLGVALAVEAATVGGDLAGALILIERALEAWGDHLDNGGANAHRD